GLVGEGAPHVALRADRDRGERGARGRDAEAAERVPCTGAVDLRAGAIGRLRGVVGVDHEGVALRAGREIGPVRITGARAAESDVLPLVRAGEVAPDVDPAAEAVVPAGEEERAVGGVLQPRVPGLGDARAALGTEVAPGATLER